MQLDPTLVLHNEGEWSKTSLSYSAFNDGGVECEVGEYLYSLIRVLKPEFVLETGTHKGIGASYMGLALQDNGFGQLHTVEFLKPLFIESSIRLHQVGLMGSGNYVTQFLMDVKDFSPKNNYQLVLLDTEPDIRFAELLKFYPYLSEGGFVFIHDTPRNLCQGNVNPDHPQYKSWPFGDIPEEMKMLVREDKLRPFHLSNPRGMIGFYKVDKERDYLWQ